MGQSASGVAPGLLAYTAWATVRETHKRPHELRPGSFPDSWVPLPQLRVLESADEGIFTTASLN